MTYTRSNVEPSTNEVLADRPLGLLILGTALVVVAVSFYIGYVIYKGNVSQKIL